MRCIHTTIQLASDNFPIERKEVELCLQEDGWLVFDFEGHDGGGSNIRPEEVDKLINLLKMKGQSWQ